MDEAYLRLAGANPNLSMVLEQSEPSDLNVSSAFFKSSQSKKASPYPPNSNPTSESKLNTTSKGMEQSGARLNGNLIMSLKYDKLQAVNLLPKRSADKKPR